MRSSGAVGESVDILMRGTRSINGSNAPLFVIDGVQFKGIESLRFVDGSYLKLKTITLGYTLPKFWMDKIGVQKLRIYGTVVSYIWVFSRTLGNINDINNFYVENDKRQIPLSSTELKKISFTTLEDMIEYKEQNPNKKKIRINLVEITIKKESFIYNDVKWKRKKTYQ